MQQANPKNTSKALSRRSAIALAGASAIAVSAVSTAIAGTATNPDAELLALGARLETIIQEWIAERAIDARQREAHKRACLDADLPSLDFHSTPFDQWQERNLVRGMVHYIGKEVEDADLDEHGASIKWTRIHDRMFPLCEDILSRHPTSIPGLGVQARAASLYFEGLWDSDGDDEDPEGAAQRSFIESVSAFSGVVPVPIEAAARDGSAIPARASTPPEPDPIFAAIERHRKACAAYADAALAEDRLEPAKPWYPEAEADLARANDEEDEAALALTDTSPTTIAGMVALLRHVFEHNGKGNTTTYTNEDGHNRPWANWICDNVAAALEKMNPTT